MHLEATHRGAVAACVATATLPLSNVESRILTWIAGVALLQGCFPVSVTHRQIRYGLHRGSQEIQGTKCHMASIQRALVSLAEQRLILVEEGEIVNGGHRAVNLYVQE